MSCDKRRAQVDGENREDEEKEVTQKIFKQDEEFDQRRRLCSLTDRLRKHKVCFMFCLDCRHIPGSHLISLLLRQSKLYDQLHPCLSHYLHLCATEQVVLSSAVHLTACTLPNLSETVLYRMKSRLQHGLTSLENRKMSVQTPR